MDNIQRKGRMGHTYTDERERTFCVDSSICRAIIRYKNDVYRSTVVIRLIMYLPDGD